MMMLSRTLSASLLASVSSASSDITGDLHAAPTLEHLSADWVDGVPLRDTPTVSNFWGNVGLRHDIASLDAMTFTPYNGNLLRSNLTVDGKDVRMNQTRWTACEAGRRTDPAAPPSTTRVVSAVRLPFEQRAVIQRWSITASAGRNEHDHSARLELDGPLFEHCSGCGWGVSLPTNRSLFEFGLRDWQAGTVMTVEARSSGPAAVAAVVWAAGGAEAGGTRVHLGPDSTFVADTAFHEAELTLYMAFAVAANVEDAVADVTRIVAEVDTEWELGCSLWEERWQQAFIPGNGHFSGNLPLLSTEDAGLNRVYYFGALMLVALERTNLGLWPRVYTISQGNPNSVIGAADMGGSGQFTWDLTFTANVLSLLDPTATKEVLRFIIASSNLAGPFAGWQHPWLVPQTWDANSAGLGPNATYSGGSEYRFDYYAAYVFISTYVRVTNDTAFLDEKLQDHTSGPPSLRRCALVGNWSDGAAGDPPIVVRSTIAAGHLVDFVEAIWSGSWHYANGTARRDSRGHTFVTLHLRQNRTSKVFANQTAVLRDDCNTLSWDNGGTWQRVGTKPSPRPNIAVRDYLQALAFSHRQFNTTPGHPHLTDYGGDKRFYLEMVPTYIHALPSLQFAKVFMLLDIAELLPSVAVDARAEASATIEEAVESMYVRGEGVWASVYPNGSKVPVRTVADFAYIGQSMGTLAASTLPHRSESRHSSNRNHNRDGNMAGEHDNKKLTKRAQEPEDSFPTIPDEVWSEMAEFAWNELWVAESHWVRALSLKDEVNTNHNFSDLLIRRADWGTGGSYGGIPGMVAEGMAAADRNFSRATELLSQCSLATYRGSIGQGIAVGTPQEFQNLTDNYYFADGLNTSFSQSGLRIPEPPYQPSWPEFFDVRAVIICPHCKLPCLMRSLPGVDAEKRSCRLRVLRVFCSRVLPSTEQWPITLDSFRLVQQAGCSVTTTGRPPSVRSQMSAPPFLRRSSARSSVSSPAGSSRQHA